jgi:hypothetical protein
MDRMDDIEIIFDSKRLIFSRYLLIRSFNYFGYSGEPVCDMRGISADESMVWKIIVDTITPARGWHTSIPKVSNGYPVDGFNSWVGAFLFLKPNLDTKHNFFTLCCHNDSIFERWIELKLGELGPLLAKFSLIYNLKLIQDYRVCGSEIPNDLYLVLSVAELENIDLKYVFSDLFVRGYWMNLSKITHELARPRIKQYFEFQMKHILCPDSP